MAELFAPLRKLASVPAPPPATAAEPKPDGAAARSGCKIELPAEGCPKHPEIKGTLDDAADGSERDPVRCMRRAVDFHNYCGSTEAITATFFEAGKPAKSKSTRRRCDVTIPSEGCPGQRENPALQPWAKEGGTFSEWWDGADDDPARCMRRAGEWVAYCGSNQAVVARFYDDARVLATQRADQRCEIALPPEGCPAHRETAGTFNDIYDGSDRDASRCQRRAAEWRDYCSSTQPVAAAFYQAGRLVTSTKSAPP